MFLNFIQYILKSIFPILPTKDTHAKMVFFRAQKKFSPSRLSFCSHSPIFRFFSRRAENFTLLDTFSLFFPCCKYRKLRQKTFFSIFRSTKKQKHQVSPKLKTPPICETVLYFAEKMKIIVITNKFSSIYQKELVFRENFFQKCRDTISLETRVLGG